MRVEPLTPALAPSWDKYVSVHADGWWWHTSGWLAYQVAYREGNRDLSFAIVEDEMGGNVVGVVPIILTHGPDDAPEFSYSGDPLAPGLADGPEVAEFGATQTRMLAAALGARRAVVASSPFGSPCILVLPERPPIQTPYNAAQRVVNLRQEPCALWRGVRRSYRSLIHRAEDRYTFTTYTGDSAQSVVGFVTYQALHRRLATTLPRSGETYRLQGEWVLDGRALITIAERPEGVFGAAYWIMYKGCAYYASGGYAADDLAHATVWRSLLALRDCGVTQASLGWQSRAFTEKERAIEVFRRGFGGADVPAQVMDLRFEEVSR